jgi:energy-coupling factor transporter ATP-binding protein EcfA2
MPVVELTGFSYRYPGGGTRALDDITLKVSAGECVCICGPSGSGKTTLLMAIQGLLNGPAEGTIKIRDTGGTVKTAMVFQNADSQILCTTVADEVAFGPENLDFSPSEITGAVDNALASVGLSGFKGRNVEELSAGETHRLTIASVLSMAPGLVLLDEPSAQLDDTSKARLIAILARLKKADHTLIIADHDLQIYRSIVDRYITVNHGTIKNDTTDVPVARIASRDDLSRRNKGSRTVGRPDMIAVDRLQLAGLDGTHIFKDASFRVSAGASVYLYGQNGTGKSTLLGCMVGFLKPDAGSIVVAGMTFPAPDKLLGKVALLFQNPGRQLFEETVYEEVAFSLKRMGVSSDRIRVDVMDTLALFDIIDLAPRSPLTLSFGEQHRVAMASVVAPRPDVLLLDEPFAGLDGAQREHIVSVLSTLRASYGTTVVIASHTSLPDPGWADTTLILKEGMIEAR